MRSFWISVYILGAVSCPSSASCKAVGSYETNTHTFSYATLVESWNGTAWTIQASPNNGTTSNFLNGISCQSTVSCKAAGSYNNSSFTPLTLVESYG